jgi:predicted TIM-barrel fold metal-dependent hydrolase
MTRRTLILGAASALTGSRIIDSHVHLFLPQFPYHPAATYRPEAHPLEQYLAFLREAPITHVVVVHPEPYQDDHSILPYIFEHEPSPGFFKSTCLFDPIDPATPDRMAQLNRRFPNRIVGMRIHEIHKPGTPPLASGPIKDRDLQNPGMKNVFRKARELSWMIQFQLIPHYAAPVAALVREFPDVPVVIDHLGRAHEGTPDEVQQVMDLAKAGKVYMKFSGPYISDAALARRAFDAFGPDRMICGYVGMSLPEYGKWNTDFDNAFAKLSSADQAKIRVATAAALFRFQ